jgi:hypothetical protein
VTRGGSRVGAGRKAALSGFEALQVGEQFEYLRIMAAEAQAIEKLPNRQAIEAAQERAQSIPIKERKRGTPEDIKDDVDFYSGGNRGSSVSLSRQYGGKTEITAATIKWCLNEFGQRISASKAVECWKKYRKFQKDIENNGSLNST